MLEMSMSPNTEMRVTPALVNLAHMLILPNAALEQLIQQELEHNPALEELDSSEEPDLELGLGDGASQVDEQLYSLLNPFSTPATNGQDEKPVDPFLFVAAPHGFREDLLADLRAGLPEADHPLALLLVESLDEQGFLVEEPAHLARMLNVEQERVEAVLQHMREIGPPGIATRNVRECILAQLEALAARGLKVRHGCDVVAHYLDELGANRCKYIAQKLHIRVDEVEAVRTFIQQYCWPYPAQAGRGDAISAYHSRYVLPDVVILEQSGDFVVKVLQAPERRLRLNPIYQELVRQASRLDEEERIHVQEYVARTRTFLNNLRQRSSTMQRISEAVVARQQDFLRKGVRYLVPLTRAEIAAEVGVHESTVSRATAEKMVLLPNSTLMPFAEFFMAARRVEDVLRELIAGETRPLSDAALARMLGERGHSVARRTVTKYRERMQILPSTMR